MRKLQQILDDEAGFLLPGVLSFIIAMTIFGTAVLMVIMNNFFVIGNNVASQKAFNIAEGGLNYYLWHLNHDGSDYKDGKTTPTTPDPTLGYGPYEHTYTDASGRTLGTYTLWLRPESTGSTIVNVRSIGKVTGSSVTRTLDAKIGASSFASYGVVADEALWFGDSETANGPVFSNEGVRMDGKNSDIVASANQTYVPPANLGGNGTTSQLGVWCSTAVVTTPTCTARDKSNWLKGQSPVDFVQVTSSLCKMKVVAFSDDPATSSLASTANCAQVPTTRTKAYLPKRGTYNAKTGYLIQLNNTTPKPTYDLYYVNGETDTATPYTSALTLAPVPGGTGIEVPSKGVIYAEDNVWVRTNSSFKGRVNIGAARLDGNDTARIVIADDLLYSAKDGSDAIGLVSEGDVTIAPYAPPATGAFNFEVDAAILAKSGSVRYPSKYTSATSRCTRGWVAANQTFTFYGSVSSLNLWTWNNSNTGNCTPGTNPSDMVKDPVSNVWYSGIMRTDTKYDYYLLYGPPPSFPITGGYQIMSWREVLTRP